jgi:hypothetical protein
MANRVLGYYCWFGNPANLEKIEEIFLANISGHDTGTTICPDEQLNCGLELFKYNQHI